MTTTGCIRYMQFWNTQTRSQELALGLVGSLCCNFGNVQMPFHPFALGDIEDKGDTLDISS